MKYLLLSFLVCILASCQNQSEKTAIATAIDYDQYLQSSSTQKSIETVDQDIQFWTKKLTSNPRNFTYISKLAGLYSKKFRLDSDVNHIYTSDSLFQTAAEINPFSNAGLYQALSANLITKHEFADAKNYAELALKEGDKKTASYYLLFDALMELGEYDRAESILKIQKHKNAFDYKIRASKMADRKGDLDQAIVLMEEAKEMVKSNPTLLAWSESNLADMYGHAGRVQDSYNAYLDVLAKNPEHYHSLQGIAWIAFAHDHNTTEAKRILQYIQQQNNDPQATLMLAEIADFENNTIEAEDLKNAYYAKVSSPEYLGMYNKYIILLEAEDLEKAALAVNHADAEQKKRPTPEMYDLLAWSYLQNGEHKKALEVAEQHVVHKTSEPDVLYHLGVIYKMNNFEAEGNKYLKEALESSFELGPLTTAKIQASL